jgi:NNMT/PNMT/TEMT family protein
MAATDVAVCAVRRARNRTSLGRWLITSGATVASTYALDAVATACGALLVASGLLAGLSHELVLVFLAISYIAWGAGLRVNLRANLALLEKTGTSTNVLSKAAHDLARHKTTDPTRIRLAAAIGYVLTELAKEVPYYAGAFGAAVVTDSVSASDAIVFLAGANLGAALYEYGLAGATRVFLRSRSPHASFEADWVPGDYLTDYYREVEPDERETIPFFVDAMRRADPFEPVLFFGVGPTLHHVFLAAGRAPEIHLADYLPANLAEIDRWLRRAPDAHDWRPFVRYTLECEGLERPGEPLVLAREQLTRARITQLLEADARKPEPLPRRYGTVVSAYCADSATADRDTWDRYMRHITGLVRPGGLFVTAALRRSRGYVVGGRSFPSANVDEDDIDAVLAPHFAERSVEVRHLDAHRAQGYSGIVLAWGRRSL